MSKAAKGGNQDIVALPALPKFDEKVERGKWCQDYDKVESDLLRNHLGADTVTLGLRSFASSAAQQQHSSGVDFDRTLPSMNDPTEADKMEAIRAASRKPRAASSLAVMMGGGNQRQQQLVRASTSDQMGHSGIGGRGAVYSALSMRADDAASSIGGISPVRQRERHRALSPAFSSVTRCMTALDSSTYGGGGGRSGSSTAMRNDISAIDTTAGNASSQHHNVSATRRDPLKSTEMCIKLLDTLLHPPPTFKNSFRLNLDGVDLSWMWHYAADRAPPQLLTLETLRDDAPVTTTPHTTIVNSPRSVMVMLRNGVSAFELVRRPTSSFESAEVDADEAHALSTHFEERRKAMLVTLRNDYRDVCSNVLLHEVVRGLQVGHKNHVAEEKARSSPLRKRSSQRAGSQTAASGTAASAAKHFLEMREKTNLYNIAHIAELEKRRIKMESKAAAKQEAQQARTEQLKQDSELKAAAKAKRLQQNRETIAALQEEELQRQAEKDLKASEKRSQLELRRTMEREEALEMQRKLAEQRLEAQERVKQQRAAFLEKAAKREREVRERLETFRENEKQARDSAHQLEVIKEKKRLQTILNAESIVRNKAQSITEKREEHMRSLELTKLQRDEMKKLQMIQDRNEVDDKRFLVNRQTNGDEFKKLLRAVRMIDKEGQARYIAEQKARSLEVAAAEREALRLQKEAAAAKIAKM